MDESYSENLSHININLEDNKSNNNFVKKEPGFITNMKDHKEELIVGMMVNKNNKVK